MKQTHEHPPARMEAGPASPAQDRFWFFDKIAPGSTMYNVGGALELDGPLDIGHLRRAVQTCVARHEILRTCFTARGARVLQVVVPQVTIAMPLIDLTGLAQDGEPGLAQAEADRLSRAELDRPFDLSRVPLLRIRLIRMAAQKHILIVNFHHIIIDQWSLELFNRDIATVYEALRAGRQPQLPELELQYIDYAVWMRKKLDSGAVDEHLQYWRDQLEDLPTLAMPADHPRPPVEAHRGSLLRLEIDPELTEALRLLARRERVTMFMTLFAAFNVLLARYTGQTDIVVGTPVAGRDHIRTHAIIGLFINMVTMRTRLDGCRDLREAIQRTADVCKGALRHQDAPFDRVVALVQRDRDRSRHPLFQVMFHFAQESARVISLGGLTVRPRPTAGTASQFDLSFGLVDRGATLGVEFEYSTDLWEEATVDRIMHAYVRVLEAMAESPETELGAIRLTSQQEDQALRRWSSAAAPEPRQPTLDRLVAERVAEQPGAVALLDGGRTWTYAEMDAQATKVARMLAAAGVHADTPVGVSMERSGDLVVSMLGILKAGGGYVVLDPANPADRLAFMVKDAGIRTVVMRDDDRPGWLPEPVKIVSLAAARRSRRSGAPAPLSLPASMANVVYTSGSTGEPKGTVITHDAIVRRITDTGHATIGPLDTVLHTSNPSFDVSGFEIWGTLAIGGRLAIVPGDERLNADVVLTAVAEHGVTVLSLTPAVFHQVAGADPAGFRGLRRVVVAGDVMDPARVRRVIAAGPPEELINAYGPTEATIYASSYRAERMPPEHPSVPIGTPLPGTNLYVLDAEFRPVPVGVVGELYIGGGALARGYLRRSGLSAEKFLPDPFANVPGARMYRTGDLARWLPDATLEFHGRADRQLKIRGFRIEPGEIEAALSHIEGVSACAVVPYEHGGDKRLVAYAAADQKLKLTSAALRQTLSARLPSYLVPAHFILLDALPMNRSGKVDRRALPGIDSMPREPETAYVAPRITTERELAAICTKHLGIADVGVNDNFFAIGGNSLLATTVILEANEIFGVRLPLNSLFELPTIAALAEQIESELTGIDASDAASIDLDALADELMRAGSRPQTGAGSAGS